VIQLDHGYNASPALGVLGRLLSSTAPASNSSIVAITLIDPFLLIMMFAAIGWAFGRRVMCIALVWWGANDLAGFDWTGGAFLSMDWLVFTVLGVCLMKRNHPTASGFALTCAAMLRVFPVFVM